MQVLDIDDAALTEEQLDRIKHVRDQMNRLFVNGREIGEMDILSAHLGYGQERMRNKQGIFKPKKLLVATLLAHRIAPPPALVVQFDNWGRKTTFPMGLQ